MVPEAGLDAGELLRDRPVALLQRAEAADRKEEDG
jgi:hypothetical protein